MVWLGVGAQLPLRRLEAGLLADALRRALAAPVSARCAQLAAELAGERGVAAATAAIKEAVGGAVEARRRLLRSLAAVHALQTPQVVLWLRCTLLGRLWLCCESSTVGVGRHAYIKIRVIQRVTMKAWVHLDRPVKCLMLPPHLRPQYRSKSQACTLQALWLLPWALMCKSTLSPGGAMRAPGC